MDIIAKLLEKDGKDFGKPLRVFEATITDDGLLDANTGKSVKGKTVTGWQYRQPKLNKDGNPITGDDGKPVYTIRFALTGFTAEGDLADADHPAAFVQPKENDSNLLAVRARWGKAIPSDDGVHYTPVKEGGKILTGTLVFNTKQGLKRIPITKLEGEYQLLK